MPHEELSGPYLDAVTRGFRLARAMGRGCGPVDFLVGISEGEGAAAAALRPGPGRSLRAVVAGAGGALGDGEGFRHMQAQEAATSLAAALAQGPAPEHLLIALIDQGTAEVLEALNRAGLDPAAVRRTALAALGAPADQPPVAMPALTPAGTLDRPPLAVSDLDARAWRVLRWRQDHLPLDRLRRVSDREALSHLERGAAWRLARQLGLDDGQCHSLDWHHSAEVERRASRARPDLAGPQRAPGRTVGAPGLMYIHRWHRRHGLLNVTVGWGVWLHNRQVGLRDRWFRLRTIPDYRGSPKP